MASDRRQFNYALKKWDILHAAEAYSAPTHDGELAVLCSGFTLGDTAREHIDERNFFEDEAYKFSRHFKKKGMGAFVISRFTYDDAIDVIKDESVSSIITIGHGDLSSIYIDKDEKLDWLNVADESTHLKTGLFSQRHCGQFMRDLSVPLGTFAMTDHSRVLGAAGVYFSPEIRGTSEEDKIRPLHFKRRLEYRSVKALFPREEFEKNDES